jgi:hypothetical protein
MLNGGRLVTTSIPDWINLACTQVYRSYRLFGIVGDFSSRKLEAGAASCEAV